MSKSKESNSFPLTSLSFFIIISLSVTLFNCIDKKSTIQQFNEEVPIYG